MKKLMSRAAVCGYASRASGLLSAAAALMSCGGDAGSLGGGATGTAVASIAIVPPGVQCVRITLRGSSTNFTVTPGAPSVLDLGPLAPGSLLVSTQAYNTACGGVTGSTAADWVSDPLSATVSAGLTTDLAISLRPNARTRATVDFVLPATQIVVSRHGGHAVMADGTVRSWGYNFDGQLGDGTTTNRSTPVQVPGLTGVRQMSASAITACAVRSDGLAACWGANTFGQLGDGTTTNETVPVLTSLPAGVSLVQIATGDSTTCGVASDATIWCWGANSNGALGNGTREGSLLPVHVLTYPGGAARADFLEVRLGAAAVCARIRSTSAVCWGYNLAGEFGDGTTSPGGSANTTPVLSNFDRLRALSMGYDFSCALEMDGTVACSGDNAVGGIGDGTTVNRLIPTPVVGLADVTSVASGRFHSCAALRDGSAWCWGFGYSGQLGDVTRTNRSSPVQVGGLTHVVEVGAGEDHTCARLADGTVWCWGANGVGQLGDGTLNDSFVPVRVQL